MKRGALLLLGLIAVAALVVFVGRASGFLQIGSTGNLQAPEIAVETVGGEIPKVQFETARLDVSARPVAVQVPKLEVGEREVSVRLPTIRIQKAADSQERGSE